MAIQMNAMRLQAPQQTMTKKASTPAFAGKPEQSGQKNSNVAKSFVAGMAMMAAALGASAANAPNAGASMLNQCKDSSFLEQKLGTSEEQCFEDCVRIDPEYGDKFNKCMDTCRGFDD